MGSRKIGNATRWKQEKEKRKGGEKEDFQPAGIRCTVRPVQNNYLFFGPKTPVFTQT